MKPTHIHVIAFCARMEQTLDACLFQTVEDEEAKTHPILKGVATAGGAIYGGSVLKRGLEPLVADRRAGLRASIPGFTQKSGLGQTVSAAGSVLRSSPLKAVKSAGAVIANDARGAGRALKRVWGGGPTLKGLAGGAILARLLVPNFGRKGESQTSR